VELLVARCAGLDVANHEVVACVLVPDGRGGRAQQVRTFQTFTSGLEALAAWPPRGFTFQEEVQGSSPRWLATQSEPPLEWASVWSPRPCSRPQRDRGQRSLPPFLAGCREGQEARTLGRGPMG
jgi:hypothetical protein